MDPTRLALALGLLKFASADKPFVGRRGNAKQYLVDSRGAGTNIALRELIVKRLLEKLTNITIFDCIGGVANSGIMWASWLAWQTKLPLAVIRPDGARNSGLQRQVEGEVAGKSVILVDNWMRTGESALRSMEAVSKHGGTAVGIALIVRDSEIPSLGIPVVAAWELSELLLIAKQESELVRQHQLSP